MGGEQSLTKSKEVYVGVELSDIHAGAMDPVQWYTELEHGVLKKIKKLAILDYFIITGDFFDQKVSMNSEHAKYALKFLSELMGICIQKETKLRIIKGTESHDNKQLELFDVLYMNASCDFKVIHTVESEWLFDNMEVLYIPEEYMADKEAYYAPFFKRDEPYDMIFGHGMVDKAAFIAVNQESETTMSKAPIFKTEDLEVLCRGPIYFGHIHKRMEIGRFRYVNSFSRWAFGEEDDKGYYLTTYSPDTGKFEEEYIVNKKARHYDTIRIHMESSLFKQEAHEQVEYLVNMIKPLNAEFIRFEIHIPEDYPDALLLTNLLNEVFGTSKRVKLKIINNSKVRQKKEVEEKVNKLLELYGFIFDKGVSYEEKISRFIKIKYNRNMSEELIRSYLYESINVSK